MNETDLVINHFTLINTLGNIITLWWIATTGFCGAILKVTIGHDLQKNSVINIGLAGLIFLFFASLIGFGLFNSYFFIRIGQSILALTPLDLIQKSHLDSLLNKFSTMVLFATSTPALFLVGWLYLVRQKLSHRNGNDKLI